MPFAPFENGGAPLPLAAHSAVAAAEAAGRAGATGTTGWRHKYLVRPTNSDPVGPDKRSAIGYCLPSVS